MKCSNVGLALLSFVTIVSLIGCGTGGSGINTPTPSTFTQDGPLNHYALAARLGATNNQAGPVASVASVESSATKVSVNEKTGANGAGMSDTAAVTGIIADTIPGAGIIFGPINVILGLFGSNASAANLQDQINTINQTLASIQTQINNLQTQINAQNSLYIAFVAQQTGNSACSALQNWDYTLANIYSAPSNQLSSNVTCGGSLNNVNNGIGNQFTNIINKQNVSTAALNASSMNQLVSLAFNNVGSFQTYVNGASASNTIKNNIQLSPAWNPSIYNYISKDNPTTSSACTTTSTSNATSSILACGYQYFIANMLPTPGVQGANVATSINNYNQLLFNMYQQDLLALQYAYTIEATSNYMNYVNYVNYLNNPTTATLTQIPSWEGMQAITFSIGGDSTQINSNTVNSILLAGQYLTSAQQNLVALYAARINALYKNIMSFVISDSPLTTQSYMPPPSSVTINNGTTTINFKAQTYTNIPAATLTSTTTGSNGIANQIPGSMLSSLGGGVFYQYNGINQLWSCTGPSTVQTLTNPNGPVPTLNLTNCASVFPNSGDSYYDGVSIQAYGANSGSAGGVSQTNMLNMGQSCIPMNVISNSLSMQAPSVFNNNVLQCSYYGGSNYVNSTVFPGNSSIPSVGAWGAGGWLLVSNSPNQYGIYSYSYLGLYFLASSTSSGYTYQSGGGNFWVTTQGSAYIPAPFGTPLYDGGFGKDAGVSYHSVLMQVTLPNGYVAPFYIATQPEEAQMNPGATGNIACPATQTTGSVCSNDKVYNSSYPSTSCILYSSQDGGQYNICVANVSTWGGGSASGSNGLYVNVTTGTPIASGIPTGSYGNYCQNITWNPPALSAQCQKSAGGLYSSSTTLNYSTCAPGSTVWDNVGVLTCTTQAN